MDAIANAYRLIKRKSFRKSSKNLPERNSRLSTLKRETLQDVLIESRATPDAEVPNKEVIEEEQSSLPECVTTSQSSEAQSIDKTLSPLKTRIPHSNTLKSKSNSLEQYNGKSFWEIDGYKKVLTRCDDGHELGIKLSEMISQRSKIEENYARDLHEWSKRWTKYLKNETTEYGTLLNTWYSLVETTEKVAEISYDLCNKLNSNLVLEIKNWLQDKYQTHIVNFNIQKQFRREFEEAQRPWEENYDKMEEAKRDYYDLVKRSKKAEEIAKLAQSDIERTEEQRRKLQLKAEQLKSRQELARDKYIDEVKNMGTSRDRYMNNMRKAFGKTQEFEKQRREFFVKIFSNFFSFLLEHVRDKRFEDYLNDFNAQISLIDATSDLEWWSTKKGADMDYNWPIFEEFYGY